MIQFSMSQVITISGVVTGAYISLLIYINNNQLKRIAKIEKVQNECPINKIYTILEKLKTDIDWIKKSLKK